MLLSILTEHGRILMCSHLSWCSVGESIALRPLRQSGCSPWERCCVATAGSHLSPVPHRISTLAMPACAHVCSVQTTALSWNCEVFREEQYKSAEAFL